MGKQSDHPEQDPAEGSRETIDRELARQGQSPAREDESETDGGKDGARKEVPKHTRPM